MHTMIRSMRPALSKAGARYASALSKSGFQDRVRQELEVRTRRTRTFGSTALVPHRAWDEFLASSPSPCINTLRNKAADLFGSVDPVIEILQHAEMDAHVPEGETPEDTKLIKLGIAASYNMRGSNWYHERF